MNTQIQPKSERDAAAAARARGRVEKYDDAVAAAEKAKQRARDVHDEAAAADVAACAAQNEAAYSFCVTSDLESLRLPLATYAKQPTRELDSLVRDRVFEAADRFKVLTGLDWPAWIAVVAMADLAAASDESLLGTFCDPGYLSFAGSQALAAAVHGLTKAVRTRAAVPTFSSALAAVERAFCESIAPARRRVHAAPPAELRLHWELLKSHSPAYARAEIARLEAPRRAAAAEANAAGVRGYADRIRRRMQFGPMAAE